MRDLISSILSVTTHSGTMTRHFIQATSMVSTKMFEKEGNSPEQQGNCKTRLFRENEAANPKARLVDALDLRRQLGICRNVAASLLFLLYFFFKYR